MRGLRILFFAGVLLMAGAAQTMAQCAMCRATLETNVSNGSETVLASSLNVGIMYLFAAPYIIIATVGVFWFRSSRKSRISE